MSKGIYKRGDIYWIRYAGLDGKMIFESSKATSFKDAETLLILRKKEVMEGKEPMSKRRMLNHTFRELSEHYLKWAERQKCFRTKKGHIGQLVEVFGSYPLQGFTTRLIEEWQTERLVKNAPATVNRLLTTFKHMLTKASEWEMIGDDALKRIRKVKLLRENNRRLRYLTKEECQALINACDPRIRPIVVTALNTGLRKGEILSLKWENIDLRHGFILLNQDQTKNHERKEIPINQTLRETLQKIPRRLDIPFVFYYHLSGNPYDNIKRSFNTALRKAGIRDFRFHDLRHTFASHLVMAGIDLTTIKELLGHKDLTMTLRYAHLAPSHKVKAVDILDNTINKKASTIQKLYNLTNKEVRANA